MDYDAVTPPATLSIVIPLFNEEQVLPSLISNIFAVLDHHPQFLEVVLVNDGSTDQTLALATAFAQRDARIQVQSHTVNRGLGAAIRTGLQAARGDYVLYTDADLPFDFALIPDLLQMAEPENIVIGFRQNRGEGGRRWLLSKGYNLLCRLLLGVWVQDVNFACKLLPRRAVRQMDLQSEGSFIDAEMLLECRRLGFGVKEFGMTYFPRTVGESTLSRPAVIFVIAQELCKYFFRRKATPVTYEIAEEIDR